MVLVLFFVIWMPAVWLLEPEQNLDQEQDLTDDAIARGGAAAVELFTEENQGGVGCVQCHGPTLEGSLIPTLTTDDPDDVTRRPNLTTVCGGPYTGHPLIYGLNDI